MFVAVNYPQRDNNHGKKIFPNSLLIIILPFRFAARSFSSCSAHFGHDKQIAGRAKVRPTLMFVSLGFETNLMVIDEALHSLHHLIIFWLQHEILINIYTPWRPRVPSERCLNNSAYFLRWREALESGHNEENANFLMFRHQHTHFVRHSKLDSLFFHLRFVFFFLAGEALRLINHFPCATHWDSILNVGCLAASSEHQTALHFASILGLMMH